jgi:hypothetical protein
VAVHDDAAAVRNDEYPGHGARSASDDRNVLAGTEALHPRPVTGHRDRRWRRPVELCSCCPRCRGGDGRARADMARKAVACVNTRPLPFVEAPGNMRHLPGGYPTIQI